VCKKCYSNFGGEAYAGEKPPNQCSAGKVAVSYHRTTREQGWCFPFIEGARPCERSAGDRGGYSALRIRRKKRTNAHEIKGVETPRGLVIVPFELKYHPDVKSVDIPLLDARLRARIKNAIETRLMTAPHLYGEPLRKTLHGYWKLRVGDYRIVFKIMEEEVWILGIIHRKKVYDAIEKRI
jgi:mRNA interferase RelE/StbE